MILDYSNNDSGKKDFSQVSTSALHTAALKNDLDVDMSDIKTQYYIKSISDIIGSQIFEYGSRAHKESSDMMEEAREKGYFKEGRFIWAKINIVDNNIADIELKYVSNSSLLEIESESTKAKFQQAIVACDYSTHYPFCLFVENHSAPTDLQYIQAYISFPFFHGIPKASKIQEKKITYAKVKSIVDGWETHGKTINLDMNVPQMAGDNVFLWLDAIQSSKYQGSVMISGDECNYPKDVDRLRENSLFIKFEDGYVVCIIFG